MYYNVCRKHQTQEIAAAIAAAVTDRVWTVIISHGFPTCFAAEQRLKENMVQLQWVKCDNNSNWCQFLTVNLRNVRTTGVYLIWHGGYPSRYIRVGQGDIAARLTAHRSDPAILQYEGLGLFVTWAAVGLADLDAVEVAVAQKANPLIGDRFPNAAPFDVNLPA